MRQLTAKLPLNELVVNGFTGLYTGKIDSKDFALTAETGRVFIRFKQHQSQRKLVGIFRDLSRALDGHVAEVQCFVDIVVNRDWSTNNAHVRTDGFKTLEELSAADLPGGEDPLAYGKAAFRITSRS